MRTLRYTLTLALVALLSGGASWCHPEDKKPADPDAGAPGADAQPPPDGGTAQCVNPCEGTQILFGPETFTRSYSAPQTFYRTFELPEAAEVCIHATNFQTAAALVRIDGDQVYSPSDFNPNVTELDTTVSLPAGQHELRVAMASAPGSTLTLEMRTCAPATQDPLCSTVAIDWCEDKGWSVESVGSGSIVCTSPGFDGGDSCLGCTQYNVVVWSDGGGDPLCNVTYTTHAGAVYGGHTPCECADNLMECGIWDMLGCIPD